MKDILTFYTCETRTLEEKIMPRDMIEGTEFAGYLERLGKNVGTLYFDHFSIGAFFQAMEAVYEVPFHYLMGQGERRLDPSGPVTYCGRQIPSELGEFVTTIQKLQKLLRESGLNDADRARLERWNELSAGIGLDKEPHAIEQVRRYLNKFRKFDPELISAYECW